MSKTTPTASAPLATWFERITEIPERGLATTRKATAAECRELAAGLDVLACDRFEATYKVRALGGGRYHVEGSLAADVTQACIVTLEPVPATISETFEEDFWPPELIPEQDAAGEADEREALAVTAPEPILQGRIEIGQLLYEHLSTALDPYPRAPGADFSWSESGADAGSTDVAAGPFAALASLKDNEKGGRE